ncbi:MAG: Holin-like protein CidA [Candidatus Dichloromethanomonas elyunquensis]|nr:MAG: Holin-like protein CidA [Candidatus Dichloromethanomonas elyunquensis]
MIHWLRVIPQITLLWVIYQSGNFLAKISHLPVPGNVLGMVLLFILLLTGVIPIAWVEDGADLLLKHLAFFFIPIAVGLMQWIGLFELSGVQLISAIFLGSSACILVMGTVSKIFAGIRSGKGGI